jgi:hypothetical protein
MYIQHIRLPHLANFQIKSLKNLKVMLAASTKVGGMQIYGRADDDIMDQI